MLVLGLLVLTAALIVGSVGAASNTGAAHQLPESFGLFGYHVQGSVGKLFFAGLVVGAMGMIGLVMVVDGLRRNAAVRRELARVRREDRTAPPAPTPTQRSSASRPLEPQPPAIPAPKPRPPALIGASSSPRRTPPGSSGSHRRTADAGTKSDSDASSGASSSSASTSTLRRNPRSDPSKPAQDRSGTAT